MRTADAWPSLKDEAGKIIVLLHPCDVTDEYISSDTSLASQAMFPMLRLNDIDRDCASFIILNSPAEVLKNNEEIIHEKNLIVRTMSDTNTNVSQEKIETAFECDAQIISTDHPPKSDPDYDGYVVLFDGYATVRKVW